MARACAKDNGSKKRRGRPPGSRKSDAPKPTLAKEKTKQKRKRKSREEEDDEDELSGMLVDQAQSSGPRKRQAHNELDEMAEEGPKARKKYAQLESRTKRIPQEQIETWPQVSAHVLEQIVAVIRDAKKDIANTQRDERKVIAAHNTLNPLVKKLARQLAASRIPPQAKDIHFSIDKLTERNAQVSREVTTARHSKQLLSEQVRVAEHMLEKDEQILEQLKKDTKKWRTEWKHQEKHGRIHPLLLESEKTGSASDGPDDICLNRTPPLDAALLAAPDAELAHLLEQLQRSLENMQGNHAHVDGIHGALRDTQAALDEILFKHASAQQYATL